jgi:hypothetical protein
MWLTRNFSLEQLIYSATAERERIDNTPGLKVVGYAPQDDIIGLTPGKVTCRVSAFRHPGR